MPNKRPYHFLMIPSELGCSKRGAGLGPQAILLADIDRKGDLFHRFPLSKVKDRNFQLLEESKFIYAKNIDGIVQITEDIILELELILKKDEFPIILTGDHSNAIGGISGIKNFFPNKKLGVVWIDAHGDLHSPYTTPSGNVHGMPLAACLGDVYHSVKINQPQDETMRHWKSLLYAGSENIHPKILPEDLVFIDIRDLEKPEWNDIIDNEIKYYGPKEVKSLSIEQIANETLQHLESCDIIYLSFDVDSMDPSVSVGTGTSVPDGLTLNNAKELLKQFMKSEKIVCLEITEVNPLIDQNNKMAKAVLEIFDFIL